jgi:LysM repeat protein
MAITRKDIVIVTVLFNTVILTCILATAKQIYGHRDGTVTVAVADGALDDHRDPSNQIGVDEIDQLLEDCIPEVEQAEHKKPAPPQPPSPAKTSSKKSSVYVVKQGDNPWKIAKQFHISFEKLLELNHLDEAKARNLKIGQTLRIKEEHE